MTTPLPGTTTTSVAGATGGGDLAPTSVTTAPTSPLGSLSGILEQLTQAVALLQSSLGGVAGGGDAYPTYDPTVTGGGDPTQTDPTQGDPSQVDGANGDPGQGDPSQVDGSKGGGKDDKGKGDGKGKDDDSKVGGKKGGGDDDRNVGQNDGKGKSGKKDKKDKKGDDGKVGGKDGAGKAGDDDNKSSHKRYTVKQGETLATIAAKFGLTNLVPLYALNNGDVPRNINKPIEPGTVIRLPKAAKRVEGGGLPPNPNQEPPGKGDPTQQG